MMEGFGKVNLDDTPVMEGNFRQYIFEAIRDVYTGIPANSRIFY